MCSPIEIHRYWKKLGAALMDRIDMRVPVKPEPYRPELVDPSSFEDSGSVAERVEEAVRRQRERNGLVSGTVSVSEKPERFSRKAQRNGDLEFDALVDNIVLSPAASRLLSKASSSLGLSSRASRSVLRIARTIADLEGEELVGEDSLAEAVEFRRFGDGDYFWRAA